MSVVYRNPLQDTTISDGLILRRGKLYLSPKRASERFAISKATLYKWIREGQVVLLNRDLVDMLRKEGIVRGSYFIEVESLKKKHAESHLRVRRKEKGS